MRQLRQEISPRISNPNTKKKKTTVVRTSLSLSIYIKVSSWWPLFVSDSSSLSLARPARPTRTGRAPPAA